MVGIVSGYSLGLNSSSLATLAQWGALGTSVQGRNGEGAYVNVANGNLVLQDVDQALAGLGLSSGLVRTYNSEGQYSGDGWSIGAALKRVVLSGALNTAGSSIVRTDADGAQSVYQYDVGRGLYVSTDGAGAYDTIASDGSKFIWTDGATGVKEDYEAGGAGRIVRQYDLEGHTVSYSYGGNGLLSCVTNANGESIYLDYSGNNLTQIRTETNDGGTIRQSTVVRYEYDELNRLKAVTVDLSPEDNNVSDGNVYRTQYSYYGTSQYIATVAQSDGTSLAFTYVQTSSGYKVATVTDGVGKTTTYNYDVNGATFVTDPLGLVTRYDYDGAGQLTKITPPAANGTNGSTTFVYDAQGNVRQVTDGAGNVVYMEYDVNGNQVLQRDSAGNTITRVYSADNRLLTETVYTVADPDGAGAGQPGGAQTKRYVYEDSPSHRLLFVVSSAGRVTEYRYQGSDSKPSSVIDHAVLYNVSGLSNTSVPSAWEMSQWSGSVSKANARRTDMGYDFRGQLRTSTTYSQLSVDGIGAAGGLTTHYIYDQYGRLIQTVSPAQGATTYVYDGLGRVITTTGAQGTTLTRYDDAHNSTTVTYANGLVTTSSFDAAGRLSSIQQSDSAQHNLGVTRYYYDADGRLLMSEDPTQARKWAVYDDAGRKVADVDGNGGVTEYVYNGAGQVTRTIAYFTPIDTRQLVDGNGNPARVSLNSIRPQSRADKDINTWRIYDGAGRLIKEVDGDGSVTETIYDGASQVVAVKRYAQRIDRTSLGNAPSSAMANPATDSVNDRVRRNFYDADGRLTGTLDEEGGLVVYLYNDAGNQTETIRYATPVSDWLRATGTLAQLVPATAAADIHTVSSYNARGQLVRQVDGESNVTENVYDANGNLTTSSRTDHVSGQVQTQTWTYDAFNRLTSSTSVENILTQYAYDSMGRLVSTVSAVNTADVRAVRTRYDALGRVTGELSAKGAALLTGYENQAQLDAIWSQYGVTYTYDNAGRRTSSIDANGNRTLFYYDLDGQLVATINALGEVEERQYTAIGQLSATIQHGSRLSNVGALVGGLLTTDVANALSSISNAAADSVYRYSYTMDGSLESATDARGNAVVHAYNAFNQESQRWEAIGNGSYLETAYEYDRRGLLLASVKDAAGLCIYASQKYDAFGRVIESVDANQNVSSRSYDRLGRVVTINDPTSSIRSISYDAFDRVLTQTDALNQATTYSYDTAGRSVTVRTPEGVQVTTYHNAFGQTSSVIDGNRVLTSYQYDVDGNLVSTAVQGQTQSSSEYDAAGRLTWTKDANQTKTVYTYDNANRVLTRVVDPGGLNIQTSYTYDAKGQRIATVDANGVVTTTRFDLDGHALTQTIDPSGLNLTTVYTYDAAGHVLSVTNPAGAVTKYVYDVLGRRVEEHVDANALNLTRNYTYDANGNVIASTDANTKVTRYVYDSGNRLIITVDPNGNVSRQTYDADGRLSSTTQYLQPIGMAGLGTTVTENDVVGRLPAVSGATAITNNRVYDRDGRLSYTIDGVGGVVSYTYDGNGNVTGRRAYANTITRGAWTEGTAPNVVADGSRDLIIRTVYDALNRIVFTIDGVGGVKQTQYDGVGNVLRTVSYYETMGMNSTLPTDWTDVALWMGSNLDVITTFTYDRANRLISSVDGMGAVKVRTYDPMGNLTKLIEYARPVSYGQTASDVTTDGNDRVTRMTYDTVGRLVFKVDALGGVTRKQYDRAGNVVADVAYLNTWTSTADPSTSWLLGLYDGSLRAAAYDRVTRYAYDGAGRQTFAMNAEGAVTQYRYDGVGHVVSQISYATPLNNQGYGLQVSASDLNAAVRLSLNSTVDRVTASAYDEAGRLIFYVDPRGYVTRYSYDGAGRVTETVKYAIALSSVGAGTVNDIANKIVANALDQRDTFVYDAAGRLISSSDSHSNTESFTYDGIGNKTSFTDKSRTATTYYEYDTVGRLTYKSDPEVAVTRVVTGSDGHLAIDESKSGMYRLGTHFNYDGLGNLIVMVEGLGSPEGRTTYYSYDALGRQIGVSYQSIETYNAVSDTTSPPSWQSQYSKTYYDAFGNATANRDVSGNFSYKIYDKLGRIIADIDAEGYVTAYSRDVFGDVRTLTRYANATSLQAVSYLGDVEYGGSLANGRNADVANLLASSSMNSGQNRILWMSYDRMGHTQATTQQAIYTYDPNKGSNAYSYESLITQSTYDAFGQLTRIDQKSGTSVVGSEFYFYDQSGNRIATVDAAHYLTREYFDGNGRVTTHIEYANDVGGDDPVRIQYSGQTSEYGAAVTFAMPTSSYLDRTILTRYDALGQKTSETKLGVGYTTVHNATVSEHVGDLTTSYEYDAVGNLTSTTDAMGAKTSTYYDAMRRIVAIKAADNSIIGFGRDAFGNVVQQIAYQRTEAPDNYVGFKLADAVKGRMIQTSTFDHVTLSRYDARGNVVQTSDDYGGQIGTRYAYDAAGRVTKQWQVVTGNDGTSQTLYTKYVYDRLGQQTSVIQPTADVNSNGTYVKGTQYNAFGEVESRTVDGGWFEYNEYDNAGHLIKTNAGNPSVDKIMLYDVRGRNTAQITSDGSLNLRYMGAQSASQLSNVRRTNQYFDALGNVVRQDTQGRQSVQGGVSVNEMVLASPHVNSSTYIGDMPRFQTTIPWDGQNSVTFNWSSLDGLGGGDVKVQFEYTTNQHYGGAYGQGDEVTRTHTEVLAAGQANNGATITWKETYGQVGDWDSSHGGIRNILHVAVYKKDLNGNWQLMLDRSNFGSGQSFVEIDAANDPSAKVEFYARPIGSNDWGVPRSITNFGEGYRFDTNQLGAGTYEYRVTMRPNGGNATEFAKGTLVVGNGVSVSPTVNGKSTYEQPSIYRAYDRWGNVIRQSDARMRNWETNYAYDANNNLIAEWKPSSTGAAYGGPVSYTYYDKNGAQVGTMDANGNVNTTVRDAMGRATSEYHADGGRVSYVYDLFGNKVISQDAEGGITRYSYDTHNRLKQMSTAGITSYALNNDDSARSLGYGSLNTSWSYDAAGRVLKQTNSDGSVIAYDYDRAGNVIKTSSPGGITTSARFDNDGHKVWESDANGNVSTSTYSHYGQLVSRTDIGGATYQYRYDLAGQLATTTSSRGQSLRYKYDQAGQLIEVDDFALNQQTYYEYDLAGNHLRERTVQNGIAYQDNYLAYDALGRLRSVADGRVSMTIDYDDNGNRTHIKTSVLNSKDQQSGGDSYFAYDKMNRQILIDGAASYDPNDSRNINSKQGHVVTYDYNGNQTSDRRWGTNGSGQDTVVTDNYQYDRMGRLYATSREGHVLEYRYYDTASRLIKTDRDESFSKAYTGTLYKGAGGAGAQGVTIRYDAAGRVTQQVTRDANRSVMSTTNYNSYDSAGNLIDYRVYGQSGSETHVVNTYTKMDGYRQTYSGMTFDSGKTHTSGATTQYYDVNSNLVGVSDQRQETFNRSFINDMSGKVLYVNQYNQIQRQLVVNDQVLGRYGQQMTGTDEKGRAQFSDVTDFNFTYQSIDPGSSGSNAMSYTVQQGDTLESIARSVYGDSQLWYVIAEANGLAASRDLQVGSVVQVPSKAGIAHNNQNTFKPYDASKIVGDTTPQLPAPGAGSGCGGAAMIIMIIVAVVATIFTAGAAALAMMSAAGASVGSVSAAAIMSAGGVALSGGAAAVGAVGGLAMSTTIAVSAAFIGGAVGSIVSQGVGMAMGVQDKFSWSSVGISAVSAAVTSGAGAALGETGMATLTAKIGSQSGAAAVRAAAINATTQGVAVATGLQKKFSWTSVAASAAGGAMGQALGAGASGNTFGENLTRGAIAGIGAGLTTAALKGGRADITQVAVDAFGNALANGIASSMSSKEGGQAQTQQRQTYVEDGTGDHIQFGQSATSGNYDIPGVEVDPKTGQPISKATGEPQRYDLSKLDQYAAADNATRQGTLSDVGKGLLNGFVMKPLAAGDALLTDSFESGMNWLVHQFNPEAEPYPGAGKRVAAFREGLLNSVEAAADTPAYMFEKTMNGVASLFGMNGTPYPDAVSPRGVYKLIEDQFAAGREAFWRGDYEASFENNGLGVASALGLSKAPSIFVSAANRVGGVAINGSTRTVPLGFESEAQFIKASQELQTALRNSGIDDAVVGARGSSVTGITNNPKSENFGNPFGPDSDVDFFVQSQKLVDGFKKTPDFIHPEQVIKKYPELAKWSARWTEILGREITPAAWKPGALPQTPAILVKPQ
ncbi:MAG: LysM peptidoglycan-binding domain-containing protein [Rhodocyclaceae bacterium]